jgi:hypothetical protein
VVRLLPGARGLWRRDLGLEALRHIGEVVEMVVAELVEAGEDLPTGVDLSEDEKIPDTFPFTPTRVGTRSNGKGRAEAPRPDTDLRAP